MHPFATTFFRQAVPLKRAGVVLLVALVLLLGVLDVFPAAHDWLHADAHQAEHVGAAGSSPFCRRARARCPFSDSSSGEILSVPEVSLASDCLSAVESSGWISFAAWSRSSVLRWRALRRRLAWKKLHWSPALACCCAASERSYWA